MKFVEILLLAFITRISCSGVINEISCDFSDGFCRYEHYHGDRWTIKSIDTFRQSVLTDGPLSEPAGGGRSYIFKVRFFNYPIYFRFFAYSF